MCRAEVSQLEWTSGGSAWAVAGMPTNGRCEPTRGEVYDGMRPFLRARAAGDEPEIAAEASRVLASLGARGALEDLDWLEERNPLQHAEERANEIRERMQQAEPDEDE